MLRLHLSRVEALVFLLDEFLIYVGVYLGGTDVGVAQQFLQHAKVHARFQAVGCKTVAEGVWRHLLGQVQRMLLHNLPGAHAAHGLAVSV